MDRSPREVALLWLSSLRNATLEAIHETLSMLSVTEDETDDYDTGSPDGGESTQFSRSPVKSICTHPSDPDTSLRLLTSVDVDRGPWESKGTYIALANFWDMCECGSRDQRVNDAFISYW